MKRLCTKCGLEYKVPIKTNSTLYHVLLQQLELHNNICDGIFIDGIE